MAEVSELDRLRLRAVLLDKLRSAGVFNDVGGPVGDDVLDDITNRLIAGDFEERVGPLFEAAENKPYPEYLERAVRSNLPPDERTADQRLEDHSRDQAVLGKRLREEGGHVPDFLKLMHTGTREGGEDGQGVPRPESAEMIFGVPAAQVWDAQRADGKKTGRTFEDSKALSKLDESTLLGGTKTAYSEGTRRAVAHTEQDNLVNNLAGLSLEQRAARDKQRGMTAWQLAQQEKSMPSVGRAMADFQKNRDPQSEDVGTFSLEALSHPDHSIAHGINNISALGDGAWRAWTDTRSADELTAGEMKPGTRYGLLDRVPYNYLFHHVPAAQDQGRLLLEQNRRQRIIPKGMTHEEGHKRVDQTVADNQPITFDDSYRKAVGNYPTYALSTAAWLLNGMIDPSIFVTGPAGLITRGLAKGAAVGAAKVAGGAVAPTLGRIGMRQAIKTAKGASKGYLAPGLSEVGQEGAESILPALGLSAAGGAPIPLNPLGTQRTDLPFMTDEEHAKETKRKEEARRATDPMAARHLLDGIRSNLMNR